MGDYRGRNRGNSIFSDDDRSGERSGESWRGSGGWQGNDRDWNRGTSQDERGFFERAGDEVRSWFGDEDAERRRERDARAQDHDRDHWRSSDRYSRARYPAASESDYQSGGFGDGGFGGSRRPSFSRESNDRFSSHHDEAYRNWRDQQIASLDREYDEYRRHRQAQFEQDFTNFRQNRQSITSGGTSLSQSSHFEPQEVSAHSAAGESPGQDATTLSTGAEKVTADANEVGRSARNR